MVKLPGGDDGPGVPTLRNEEDGNPPALGAGNTVFDSRVPDRFLVVQHEEG